MSYLWFCNGSRSLQAHSVHLREELLQVSYQTTTCILQPRQWILLPSDFLKAHQTIIKWPKLIKATCDNVKIVYITYFVVLFIKQYVIYIFFITCLYLFINYVSLRIWKQAYVYMLIPGHSQSYYGQCYNKPFAAKLFLNISYYRIGQQHLWQDMEKSVPICNWCPGELWTWF